MTRGCQQPHDYALELLKGIDLENRLDFMEIYGRGWQWLKGVFTKV